MVLALSVRIIVNPRKLLKSRWIHDTAHRIIDSLRRARDEVRRRDIFRKNCN